MAAIDLAGFGSILQGIGTCVGSFAVIYAAFIGSRTFDNWKKQKIAERHIDQAEKILAATYKVRRALSYVRSPVMLAHELSLAEKDLKDSGEWDSLSPIRREKFAQAQAYFNRIKSTQDAQQELNECQPIANALFGNDLAKAIEELNRQFWMVRVYVNGSLRENESNPEFQHKINAAMWEGYLPEEKNEIDRAIDVQVKIIESICVPILRSESKLYK